MGGKALEIPQVVRTYMETFTRDGLDAWIATFAPDGTYSDPSIPKPVPAHGLKEHFVGFFTGFPDGTFELVGIDAISERVWVWRWIFHGTNTGPYRGIPPTGRSATFSGCEFIEIRGDHIHSVQVYFDRLSIMSQLGLAPSPAPSPL